MTAFNNSHVRRFVRITYQECTEIEGPVGSFRTWGIEQDIRLEDGYFDIADDHDGVIEMDIVNGILLTPEQSRKVRQAARREVLRGRV